MRAADRLVGFVAEKDIDLLLLEELHASETFRKRSLFALGISPDTWIFRAAHQSVGASSLGETDILAEFEGSGGRVLALLIEDKIAAPFQPEQPRRYHDRGREGILANKWTEFRTLLVAPSSYLRRSPETQTFDGSLAYEDVIAHFEGEQISEERRAFKIALLLSAIDQERRGYVATPDAIATAVWQLYHEIATQRAPQLLMAPPGPKPARSTWITFRPPGLPPGATLRHKLVAGAVDLQLGPRTDLSAIGDALEEEMIVAKTGGSFSLRIPGLPRIDFSRPPEEQIEAIETGVDAAKRLAQWAALHASKLSGAR